MNTFLYLSLRRLIDFFRANLGVAQQKTSFLDDKNNKEEEDDEYFALKYVFQNPITISFKLLLFYTGEASQ